MSRDDVTLHLGDCLDILPRIPDQSISAIICDPPYPCIDRPYGRMTEAEWHAMMRGVVAESRRILKPSGSAVFILQPNSERAGKMRPWLWEFMAWTTREWNMVQDAYWWNHGALPTEMANHQGGMRASLKYAVWLGEPDCYRDQSSVLIPVAEATKNDKRFDRHEIVPRAGTPKSFNRSTLLSAAKTRGGATPYNVLVCTNTGPNPGHGARTPEPLCDWWVRYLTPPSGIVLDPFAGSGTTGLAALKRGRRFIGIERDAGYFKIAQSRLAAHQSATPLLTG